MYLEKLKLFNFRNLANEQLYFAPGLNLLIGKNGQGKTNLVEAIHFLSLSRSFRTSAISDLVAWDKREASVFGTLKKSLVDEELGIVIEKGKKQVFLNGERVKSVATYVGHMCCVGFSPGDLSLVKGAPQGRRRLVDRYMSQLDKGVMEHLLNFNKAQQHKSSILKSARPGKEELLPWNEILIKSAYYIEKARLKFIAALEKEAQLFHQEYSACDGKLSLRLKSSFDLDELSLETIRAKYEQYLEREIDRHTTLVGPHRDDILIQLNNADSRAFASQGQARSIVLALILGVIKLLEDDFDDAPIILLDDVESELDRDRSEAFFNLILSGDRQVFITGTDLSSRWQGLKEEAALYTVGEGEVLSSL